MTSKADKLKALKEHRRLTHLNKAEAKEFTDSY